MKIVKCNIIYKMACENCGQGYHIELDENLEPSLYEMERWKCSHCGESTNSLKAKER